MVGICGMGQLDVCGYESAEVDIKGRLPVSIFLEKIIFEKMNCRTTQIHPIWVYFLSFMVMDWK